MRSFTKSHFYHGLHPQEVRQYQSKIFMQVESQITSEIERERWKAHHLYKNNTKLHLEAMCRNARIPVTPALHKHQLVHLICEHRRQTPPEASQSGHLLRIFATNNIQHTASNHSKIEKYLKILLTAAFLP